MKPLSFIRRELELSTSYKWDILFSQYAGSEVPDPPSPFNEFFPAESVDVEIFDFQESTVTTAGITASYPTGAGLGQVSFTTYLDDEGKLAKWFELQEKLRYKRKPLASLVVSIDLKKYNRQNKLIEARRVIGYLASPFKRTWNSESGVETVSLMYKIVGFLEG